MSFNRFHFFKIVELQQDNSAKANLPGDQGNIGHRMIRFLGFLPGQRATTSDTRPVNMHQNTQLKNKDGCLCRTIFYYFIFSQINNMNFNEQQYELSEAIQLLKANFECYSSLRLIKRKQLTNRPTHTCARKHINGKPLESGCHRYGHLLIRLCLCSLQRHLYSSDTFHRHVDPRDPNNP